MDRINRNYQAIKEIFEANKSKRQPDNNILSQYTGYFDNNQLIITDDEKKELSSLIHSYLKSDRATKMLHNLVEDKYSYSYNQDLLSKIDTSNIYQPINILVPHAGLGDTVKELGELFQNSNLWAFNPDPTGSFISRKINDADNNERIHINDDNSPEDPNIIFLDDRYLSADQIKTYFEKYKDQNQVKILLLNTENKVYKAYNNDSRAELIEGYMLNSGTQTNLSEFTAIPHMSYEEQLDSRNRNLLFINGITDNDLIYKAIQANNFKFDSQLYLNLESWIKHINNGEYEKITEDNVLYYGNNNSYYTKALSDLTGFPFHKSNTSRDQFKQDIIAHFDTPLMFQSARNNDYQYSAAIDLDRSTLPQKGLQKDTELINLSNDESTRIVNYTNKLSYPQMKKFDLTPVYNISLLNCVATDGDTEIKVTDISSKEITIKITHQNNNNTLLPEQESKMGFTEFRDYIHKLKLDFKKPKVAIPLVKNYINRAGTDNYMNSCLERLESKEVDQFQIENEFEERGLTAFDIQNTDLINKLDWAVLEIRNELFKHFDQITKTHLNKYHNNYIEGVTLQYLKSPFSHVGLLKNTLEYVPQSFISDSYNEYSDIRANVQDGQMQEFSFDGKKYPYRVVERRMKGMGFESFVTYKDGDQWKEFEKPINHYKVDPFSALKQFTDEYAEKHKENYLVTNFKTKQEFVNDALLTYKLFKSVPPHISHYQEVYKGVELSNGQENFFKQPLRLDNKEVMKIADKIWDLEEQEVKLEKLKDGLRDVQETARIALNASYARNDDKFQENLDTYNEIFKEEFGEVVKADFANLTMVKDIREINNQVKNPSKRKKPSEKLYASLCKIINLDKEKAGFYQRLGENGDAFEPLSLEIQSDYGIGSAIHPNEKAHTLIMEQNYIQNGDLMSDPRIDFVIFPNLKEAIPLNFTQHGYPQTYQEYVQIDPKKGVLYDLQGIKQTNSFVTKTWVPNLISQERSYVQLQKEQLEKVESEQTSIQTNIQTDNDKIKNEIDSLFPDFASLNKAEFERIDLLIEGNDESLKDIFREDKEELTNDPAAYWNGFAEESFTDEEQDRGDLIILMQKHYKIESLVKDQKNILSDVIFEMDKINEKELDILQLKSEICLDEDHKLNLKDDIQKLKDSPTLYWHSFDLTLNDGDNKAVRERVDLIQTMQENYQQRQLEETEKETQPKEQIVGKKPVQASLFDFAPNNEIQVPWDIRINEYLELKKADDNTYEISCVLEDGSLITSPLKDGDKYIQANDQVKENIRKELFLPLIENHYSAKEMELEFQKEDVKKIEKELATIENENIQQNKDLISSPSFKSVPKEKLEDFGEKIGGARKDAGIQRRSNGQGKTKGPAWRKNYTVCENESGNFSLIYVNNKKKYSYPKTISDKFESYEAASDFIPIAECGLKHKIYERKNENGVKEYAIYRRVTSRKTFDIKGGFKSKEEADMYLISNAQDIINFKLPEPVHPHLDEVARIGNQWRKDDVSPEMFHKTFGFRGVEFGNWLNQDERQKVLNMSYDGLMDLAHTLSIPPKAISLGGALSAAFGSRGAGLSSTVAHYEPSRAVFNLTRIKGAGSLAHEWFHAFDHYMARLSGQTSRELVDGVFPNLKKTNDSKRYYASNGFSFQTDVRPELKEAFKSLYEEMTLKMGLVDVNLENLEKRINFYKKNIEESLNKIELNLKADYTNDKYVKRMKKPASEDQMKVFNVLKERINVHDFGGQQWYGSKRGLNGDYLWDVCKELSDLYKKVRGRAGLGKNGLFSELSQKLSVVLRNQHEYDQFKETAQKQQKVSTEFFAEARRLDRGTVKDYYSTPHELLARAFAAYVSDKIESKNEVSQYLVYGADNSFYKDPLFGDTKPFPEGEEREVFNQTFDKFFDEIKIKEEQEKTILFKLASDEKINQVYPSNLNTKEVDGEMEKLSRELNSNIVMVENVDFLPKDILDTIDTRFNSQKDSGKIKSLFSKEDNTVYLIQENLNNLNEAKKFVLHELVGHKGIETLLGNRIDPILDMVYNGMNKKERSRLGHIYNTKNEKLIAREYIAEMAEKNINPNLFSKVLRAFRSLFRKLFNISYNKSEVALLLQKSEEALKNNIEIEPTSYLKVGQRIDFVQSLKNGKKIPDNLKNLELDMAKWLDMQERNMSLELEGEKLNLNYDPEQKHFKIDGAIYKDWEAVCLHIEEKLNIANPYLLLGQEKFKNIDKNYLVHGVKAMINNEQIFGLNDNEKILAKEFYKYHTNEFRSKANWNASISTPGEISEKLCELQLKYNCVHSDFKQLTENILQPKSNFTSSLLDDKKFDLCHKEALILSSKLQNEYGVESFIINSQSASSDEKTTPFNISSNQKAVEINLVDKDSKLNDIKVIEAELINHLQANKHTNVDPTKYPITYPLFGLDKKELLPHLEKLQAGKKTDVIKGLEKDGKKFDAKIKLVPGKNDGEVNVEVYFDKKQKQELASEIKKEKINSFKR